MDQKRYPFDYSLTVSASAGSNDVETPVIRSGRLGCIQRVSVENETSGAADVRIMKAGTGGELLVGEEDQVQEATLYWISDPVYLHEGQYLVARFSGCAADDVLKMYVTGWWRQIR